MSWEDLETALSATESPVEPPVRRLVPGSTDGPGALDWDGSTGHLNTRPMDADAPKPLDWSEYLKDHGLDPADVEVVEPVRVRGWDANLGGGEIKRMIWYSLTIRSRRPGPSIDELIDRVKSGPLTHAPAPHPELPVTDGTFVVALGDLQLGKIDGDGVAGTTDRIMESLDRALNAYLLDWAGIPVHFAWLGDCVEGFVSQGGKNAPRTTLTITEQIRLLRQIMLHSVELFAPHTRELTHVGVPGNHDQGIRPILRFDDSFDTESLLAVRDSLALASRAGVTAFDHVKFYTPGKDELTVTRTTADGSAIAHAHGHMWSPGKGHDWLAGQSYGDQPVGQADILLSGHLHHLRVEQSGWRTWIQVPSFEQESTWWRHRKGQVGAPGLVTMAVNRGRFSELTVR